MCKMRRFIIIVFAVLLSVPLVAQNVTNTDCRQEGNRIVVTYSLDKPADIELWYSTDGGKIYKGPLKKVSGDVGRNVRSGNNSIVWDVLEEVESLVGTGIVFKVVPGSAAMAVDLGLSVKWASCNLGAGKPEEYGDYYAWGATSPKKDYSLSTYKWCKGSGGTLTKYCPSGYSGYWAGSGRPDNKTVLDPQDDAAHVNLGGSWRMPTDDEWTELRNKCDWKWTGRGYKVTGPSGKSISLPAAGGRYGTSLFTAGSNGNYWSSSLGTDYPYSAWGVYFYSYEVYRHCDYGRYYGFSVRPVSE